MVGRIPRLVILTALLLSAVKHAPAQPPVDQQWLVRYDGQMHGNDVPAALAVDQGGNIIVTGVVQNLTSGQDWATVKYDSSGAVIWTNVYNGSNNGSDSATCLGLGPGGDVFVGGSSEGLGTGQDFQIVKYDGWGAQLWSARYDGPDHLDDHATALALDGQGNLYVTGISRSAETGEDYLTLKLGPLGDTLWTARYTGPGDSLDQPVAIAVDSVGDIYVTGSSWGGNTDFDWVTIKYSPQGDTLWVRRYNGPGGWEDFAFDLAVSANGNVAVTGTVWYDSHEALDACTILYSPAGDLLWSNLYNGIQYGEADDFGRRVQIDRWGNVIITGSQFNDGFGTDFLTIKYNAAGDTIWTQHWDSPIHADDGFDCQLALDNFGNVYVGGSCLGEDYYFNYVTFKYNAAGTLIWEILYPGLYHGANRMRGLALSPDQQFVYVTGLSSGAGTGLDYATIKYRQYNQPPQILGWEPVDLDSVVQGDTLTFRMSATDPDSEAVTIQWVRDGQIVGQGTSVIVTFDSLGSTRISASVSDGQASDSVVWNITVVEPNGILGPDPLSPLVFELFPPQPNPFNASTALTYQLSAFSEVQLSIWDITGRLITILVNERQSTGEHTVTFYGSALASGIYLVRLQAGNQTLVQKVALMK
jgi:hypothetical protein